MPLHSSKPQKTRPPQNALTHLPAQDESKLQSPTRPVFSQGHKYNDHSALLLHNRNLSGLNVILDKLKQLTEPLDVLLLLNQHMLQNQKSENQSGNVNNQAQMVNPEDYERELVKLYLAAQQ